MCDRLLRQHWALAKELGLDRDGRLAVYSQALGREVKGSKGLSGEDLGAVLRLLRARVDRHREETDAGGDLATRKQVGFILRLSRSVTWRNADGLERFIRQRVLKGEFRKTRWTGRLLDLWRAEATAAINALKAWTQAPGSASRNREQLSAEVS